VAEWLRSPLVYAGDDDARKRLCEILDAAYRPLPAWRHYRAMAKRNAHQHLGGPTVKLKKYFYTLRPLFCAQWLSEGRGNPPMEFATLLEELLPAGPVREAIDALVDSKRATGVRQRAGGAGDRGVRGRGAGAAGAGIGGSGGELHGARYRVS
jgi:predicted nucleotidyltransferase